MTWEIYSDTAEEYRDYTLYLPNVHGKGGQLTLSFDLDAATAYLTIRLDDVDGTEYAEQTAVQSVPLAWAYAISRGVDGWEG